MAPQARQYCGKVHDATMSGSGRSRPAATADAIATLVEPLVARMRTGFFKRRIRDPEARPGKSPVYVMKANHDKLVDIALCLLHEADRIEIDATQLVLAKAMFFADRSHLNKHGRPISWDWYLAMPKGPVPMTFYNMLMEDPKVLRKTGMPRWSWKHLEDGKRLFFAPDREPDLEWKLSPSDVAELHAALAKVKQVGVSGAIEEAHLDPAWLDAWDGDTGDYRPMSLELLFDKPNSEEALMLSRYSQQCH